VDKQIPLDGITQAHITVQPGHGLFRREADRATGCTRYIDRVGFCPVSEYQSSGVLPATIFTLGRFSLLVNGELADFGHKAPRRPLQLLKAIIAQGGRDVSISRLTLLLWPEVDGDKAARSFYTTLHRLRKLLGDDRVLALDDGKLSLDARYCWVDIWTFERLLGGMKQLLRSNSDANQLFLLESLLENSLTLYQDHFLVKEDMTGWAVSMRERLRSKYIHSLIEVGRFLESRNHWGPAIECYRKGIDVDDLVETFYQRLMVCCLNTNRLSEGMSAYRRCRQTLSIVLSLQPESETELLYIALKTARLDKKSA